MRRVRAAAACATACLVLAGCGQADQPKAPVFRTPVSAPVATPPLSPAPGTPRPSLPRATPPRTPAPATPPPSLGRPPHRTAGPAKPVTISGTVEEGVEAGCLILSGYLLIGGRDQGVRAGARLTVTGRAQPDVMTTCQQGTPLLVEKVRPG